jgi:hypothetical protein
MVAHLWANRHGHDVRTSSDNLYTRGGVLHSYGSHHVIGAFMDEPKAGPALLLWNDNTYSNTTARHSSQAWRALTGAQRLAAVRVPNLEGESLRDLPAVARDCLKSAVSDLVKSEKARQNRPHHLACARASIDAARALLTYVGNEKAAAALPEIPAEADKAQAAEVVRLLGAEEFKRCATVALDRAGLALRDALGLADALRGPAMDYTPSARRLVEHAEECRRMCESAAAYLVKAGARKPVTLGRLLKQAAALVAEFGPAALAEELAEARARIGDHLRRARYALGDIRREQRGRTTSRRLRYSRHSLSYTVEHLPTYARPADLASAAQLWPDEKTRTSMLADLRAVGDRAARIIAAHSLATLVKDERGTLANYQAAKAEGTHANAYAPDAPRLRRALEAMKRAGVCDRRGHLEREALALIEQAQAVAAERKAEAMARAAQAVERWRAGEAVNVPGDVPVMIRIKGDTVQTSRGAVVPLDHAARLIRIAKRVAAQGGRTYAQGEGPTVGHFRVNAISADLSAVIGCHDISAEESARAIALIEACAPVGEAVPD